MNLSENITLENFLSSFLRVTKGYKFTMRPIFAVVPLLLASFAAAAPFPQLSEAEFRSLRDESTPNNRVSITNGYANVRRQGRMLSGEMIDITRPLAARQTVDFSNGGARNFPDSAPARSSGGFIRMDVGPVFNLEDMLRKQAAKLKAEVKEASLKAAKAAEEAEKKLDEMVKMVVEETDATKEEVESIIEESIKEGIDEAEDIIEKELSAEEEGENVVEDEKESTDAESVDTERDLGSVQEV